MGIRQLALFVCLCAVTTVAQETTKSKAPNGGTKPTTAATGKEAKIREMMDIMGMNTLMDQMMSQMIGEFRKSMPNVPSEFWDTAEEEFRQEPFMPLVMPLYDKYFTEEDLDVIVVFYKSPTGQRLIKTLPQLTAESMQIGQQWGQRVVGRVADRMLEKGYVTKDQAAKMKQQ
jgi:hypothetical protein